MEKIRDDLAADLHPVVCWNNEFGCGGPQDHLEEADSLIALGWRKMLDVDGKPFCPTGYAQRYHDIGECDCQLPNSISVTEESLTKALAKVITDRGGPIEWSDAAQDIFTTLKMVRGN